jgi:antirestriction protein ArdC
MSKREAIAREALTRAISSPTLSNFPEIFRGFMQKGIPESEIKPRENVFTYHAWRALGRQVRRGEHGVKICTFVPTETKEVNPETGEEEVRAGKMPWTATVFHVTQTDAVRGA